MHVVAAVVRGWHFRTSRQQKHPWVQVEILALDKELGLQQEEQQQEEQQRARSLRAAELAVATAQVSSRGRSLGGHNAWLPLVVHGC
jgi:hypothetical protein